MSGVGTSPYWKDAVVVLLFMIACAYAICGHFAGWLD